MSVPEAAGIPQTQWQNGFSPYHASRAPAPVAVSKADARAASWAARSAAGQIDDVSSVLLFCIPENWHTPETLELCRRLSEDDAASVLTWLSLVFHQGHSVGFRDGQQAIVARAMAAAAAE